MGRRANRHAAAGVIALLLVGSATPQWRVEAQQALVLYDDFHAKLIDPGRWLGLDLDSTSEQAREIKGNALRLASVCTAVLGLWPEGRPDRPSDSRTPPR